MSKLVVAFFKNPSHADRALKTLLRLPLRKEIVDACAVIRAKDGAISLHQARDRVFGYLYSGLVAGMAAGGLLGWIVWDVWAGVTAGFLLGGALGILWGALDDYGMEDDFIERLGSQLKPETSALFLLCRKNIPKTLLLRLKRWRAAVIHTTLTEKAEEAVKHKLVLLQQNVRISPAEIESPD